MNIFKTIFWLTKKENWPLRGYETLIIRDRFNFRLDYELKKVKSEYEQDNIEKVNVILYWIEEYKNSNNLKVTYWIWKEETKKVTHWKLIYLSSLLF